MNGAEIIQEISEEIYFFTGKLQQLQTLLRVIWDKSDEKDSEKEVQELAHLAMEYNKSLEKELSRLSENTWKKAREMA